MAEAVGRWGCGMTPEVGWCRVGQTRCGPEVSWRRAEARWGGTVWRRLLRLLPLYRDRQPRLGKPQDDGAQDYLGTVRIPP
jgi:hypothetical protein